MLPGRGPAGALRDATCGDARNRPALPGVLPPARDEPLDATPGPGGLRATRFGNEPGSHRSSVGLHRAEDPYVGRHGLSLRLAGLEPGFNDNAGRRRVVVHGAPYVSTAHVVRRGVAGRSQGCLAVSVEAHRRLIRGIPFGSAVFVYGRDPEWLERSAFRRCSPAPSNRSPSRVRATIAGGVAGRSGPRPSRGAPGAGRCPRPRS